MIDVAFAIDAEAVGLTLKSQSEGVYDAGGNFVQDAPTTSNIRGAILPIKGAELKDMPEGLRIEAQAILWTRSALSNDASVESTATKYRILHVWNRSTEGGFYRAALGKMKP